MATVASTTSDSTIRLEANAYDPDGNLEGLFFCGWSGFELRGVRYWIFHLSAP